LRVRLTERAPGLSYRASAAPYNLSERASETGDECASGRPSLRAATLSYDQWNSFDRCADVICNSLLKQMPVDHLGSTVWDNRRKGD
jgi:hypothetical protein